jgi:hypothetical protein
MPTSSKLHLLGSMTAGSKAALQYGGGLCLSYSSSSRRGSCRQLQDALACMAGEAAADDSTQRVADMNT